MEGPIRVRRLKLRLRIYLIFGILKNCWHYILLYQKSVFGLCAGGDMVIVLWFIVYETNQKIKWPYLRLHTTHALDFWYRNRYCQHCLVYQKSRSVVRRRRLRGEPGQYNQDLIKTRNFLNFVNPFFNPINGVVAKCPVAIVQRKQQNTWLP